MMRWLSCLLVGMLLVTVPVSAQNPVSLYSTVPTTATLQSSATANGNGTALSTNGMSVAGLTVNCASCSGGTIVNFEASEDGTNYSAVWALQQGTNTLALTTTASGLTYWTVPVTGTQLLRARISAYSAGTVTVTGRSVPMAGVFAVTNANIIGTVPVSAASLPLPTGASTAAKQPALGAAGSASTDVITVQGIASMTAVKVDGSDVTQPVSGTVTATQGTAGNLNATVVGTGTFATQAAQSGTWNITNVSGTVSLPTGAATSTKQSDGSQKTQIVDGSGNVIASTSNNLNVQCANCSGSGVSAADEASFTAGTSVFAAAGGFFQTTATNNALTNGQQGAFQVTAQRSLFSNLRNASGTEVGTSTTPLQVSLANTGANTNKLLVTPDSIALPANQSVNVNQLAGTTTDTNSGTKSAGTLRVVIATDQPQLTNKLLVTPDSVALPANQSVNVNQLAGTTADTNSGTKSAGTLRVVLATDQPALTNKLLVTPDANSAVNVAQMNGVTVTMGNGTSGTGVQRVAVASDNSAVSGFGVGATGSAPPANAVYNGGVTSGATGGLLGGITVCDSSKVINVSTATTTLMVTGVSGRQVRICSFHLVTAAANNIAWLEGTGATCGTGTAGMTGGTTAASGYNFAANSGIALGTGLGEVLTTATTGDSVCLITSAATQLSGHIRYAIY